MAYPDELLVEGEQVVVHTRPHWKTLVGPGLAFLVVVAAAGYVGGLVGWAGWGLLVLGVVGGGLLVWLTVVPLARWCTTHLVVTTRRVLVREGVVSRQGIDVPIGRIDGARVSQTAVERLLGCGTLAIETASDEPVAVEDVPRVERVHALLLRDGRDG